MGKSMKTAFIRVSHENILNTGEKVYYTEKGIHDSILKWLQSKEFEYYLLTHDKDINPQTNEPVNPHTHIVIKFFSPTPFEQVKNIFPHGEIQPARSIKKSVQYLVHMNDPKKYQYDFNAMLTNSEDITKYMVKSDSTQEVGIHEIIEQIKAETLRQHETEKIDIHIYAKHKTRINNAFKWVEEKKMQNSDRNIQVIWIQGPAGSGKTTMAKNMANFRSLSYCVSSSSNDPLQDYRGQDVLIMDDLRDSTFKYQDFLKLTDNHTGSTVQSRYNNKSFSGIAIFITTTKDISDWYNGVDEEYWQFLRRITLVQKLSTDGKIVTTYKPDSDTRQLIELSTEQNPYVMTIEQQAELVENTLELWGFKSPHMKKGDILTILKAEKSMEQMKIKLGSKFGDED